MNLIFYPVIIVLDALSGEIILIPFLLLCALAALIVFLVTWIKRRRKK
ncbi:MAG: hypothetical protein ACK5Z2_14860 [Bacteroidota bacterium]